MENFDYLYSVIAYKNIGISVLVIGKKFKISGYRYWQNFQKYRLLVISNCKISVIGYRSISDIMHYIT